MFNKYRGLPQDKKIKYSHDRDELIRKPRPKQAVEEKPEELAVISSFDDVEDTSTRSREENELIRQQEEDEWFRRFKGEPEQKEETVLGPAVVAEEAVPTEESDLAQERIEIESESDYKDRQKKPFAETEKTDDVDMNHPDGTEFEDPANEEDTGVISEEIEEATVEDKAPAVDKSEEELRQEEMPVGEEEQDKQNDSVVLDELEPIEVTSELTTEEDDEKWIQDLLSDIQEKAEPVAEDESTTSEIVQPVNGSNDDPEETAELSDESEWYQSTSLIRTAALIVLELTEDEENEEYVEETPEDTEEYMTIPKPEEEPDFIPDPEVLLDPIEEDYLDESEGEYEEVTIDDVDEKLATLTADEPKTDLDMDEMLDNMDRIIQQTEPTPVKFMEEPVPAPAPQPRMNPNRNRKKRKKKKR